MRFACRTIFCLQSMFATCIFLLPLALAGCGSAETGPELFTVEGTVTFDGSPVEEGRIQFRKTEGDQKAYSTDIKAGAYSIEMEAGKASVEITASRPTGEFDTSNPGDPPQPIGEMYIPEQYNSQTTLTADVKPSADNSIPFDLKSAN